MSINNFIPTVWSETLNEEISKKYVGVANCNRDYEGEIKEMGSRVKICSINPIRLFQYTKYSYIDNPEILSDNSVSLSISRSTAFNFMLDDIDKVQATPNLMNLAMRNAAEALANDADAYVYSLYEGAVMCGSHNVINTAVTPENIIDNIIKAREYLYQGNVCDTSDVSLEVSPLIASVILKSKILYGTSDNATSLSNGCIGNFCGCSVYVSKNVQLSDGAYQCFMRTKRAITFADQFTGITAYRPEEHFADALKGLHLYGAQVICPEEMVVLSLNVAE